MAAAAIFRPAKSTVPKIRLGSGAYGSVYKVQDFAVKGCFVQKRNDFIVSLRELDNCMKLRGHDYIVQLKSISFPQLHATADNIVSPPRHKDDRRDDIIMNFEFMETNLQAIFDEDKRVLGQTGRRLLQPSQIHELIFQILAAMRFLHSKNIVHRDIKPDNFLLQRDPLIIKICDFGMSRPTTTQGDQTPRLVSPVYRAPEVACGSETYTQAIDCWSIGLIMAQLLLGAPLFWVDSDDDTILLRTIYLRHPAPLPLHIFSQIAAPPHGRMTQQNIAAVYCNRSRMNWADLLRGVEPALREVVAGLLEMDWRRRWTINQALSAPYWQNWQARLYALDQRFPLGCAQTRYHIEPSRYLNALLAYSIRAVQTARYEIWFGWQKIFLVLDIIFRYVANVATNTNTLLPDAELHFYNILYLVIKYYAAVRTGFSWREVVPAYFASDAVMEYARARERDILVVIDYMLYSPTVYDIAPEKLHEPQLLRLFELMAVTPTVINGRTPSEVLSLL